MGCRIWAASDLHLANPTNRHAVEEGLPPGGAVLLLAGDIGERVEHLEWLLARVRPRFDVVLWVPGNHELWTVPGDPDRSVGVERYERYVETCRRHDVLTPECPYSTVSVDGEPLTLVPLFLLYDHSFGLGTTPTATALERARQDGTTSLDERFLDPRPYDDVASWCSDRLAATEARLAALPAGSRTLLVNHFPLRAGMSRVPGLPAFSLWSGTSRTEDWHVLHRAALVVSGHLHRAGTSVVDGVVFEQVSLGNPHEWRGRTPRPFRQVWPRAPVEHAPW